MPTSRERALDAMLGAITDPTCPRCTASTTAFREAFGAVIDHILANHSENIMAIADTMPATIAAINAMEAAAVIETTPGTGRPA